MTFDFNAYQKRALTTALPTALHVDYLAPGLIAELGECYGKKAKAVRDGWPVERLNQELAQELGDVLWFIAVIAYVTHTKVDPRFAEGWVHACLDDALTTARELRHRRLNELERVLLHQLACVTAEAHRAGYTLDALAELNLTKLADRKHRDVLTGSGDNR